MSFDLSLIPQTAEETAAFLEAVRTVANTSSAVTKYFHPFFARNWKSIHEKYEKLRGSVPPNRHTVGSPSVVVPLIDAASQESREELQDVWAALLANSMIDDGRKVRREFIEIVRKLNPIDLAVLTIIQKPLPSTARPGMGALGIFQTELRSAAGISEDDWFISVEAMLQLGLLFQNPSQAPILKPLARSLISAWIVSHRVV